MSDAPEPVGIQRGDVVAFRNGDQSRWGVVSNQGRAGTYVVRVGGVPHAIPAASITHLIDPSQQPDLPIDSILNGLSLRVRKVEWGENAVRLQQLAKGQPSMRRTADPVEQIRDIGSSNERSEPSERRAVSNVDRADQTADVDFVRTRHSTAQPSPLKGRVKVTKLSKAGPGAMWRSSHLDDPEKPKLDEPVKFSTQPAPPKPSTAPTRSTGPKLK